MKRRCADCGRLRDENQLDRYGHSWHCQAVAECARLAAEAKLRRRLGPLVNRADGERKRGDG